jgi:hypothetical protein
MVNEDAAKTERARVMNIERQDIIPILTMAGLGWSMIWAFTRTF